jgi:SSS family solute:Na+ symporter
MTVPAAYVLMMGILIQLLFGFPLTISVICATLFTTAYIFIGGFKSDLKSDWLNFILMFGAMAITLIVLASQYGGISFLKANTPDTHFQWHGGNSAGYILSWYLIALSALIEPSFYQRVYAAKSTHVAKWGILLSIPCWLFFDFMTTTLGLYSRAILGPDQNGLDAFPMIADQVLGMGLKALFIIGMLATIQSTIDSYSLLSASTLAHDILWKVGRVRERISEVWLTRGALVISGICAIVIALVSKSAIDIWNRIGSLGTPGLMLPLALSYSPRLRYRKAWAAVNMTVSPLVVGVWFFVRDKVEAPAFPFSIEPIYVGISVALLLLAVDHLTRPKQ